MATQKNLKLVQLLNSAVRTTTTTGSSVDLQGYVNPGLVNMKAYLDVGSSTGTTASITVKIQEADFTTTFTDLTGATFTAATTGTAGEEIHIVTNKRYVRAIATYTANTTSGNLGCYLVVEQRMV